MLLTERTTAK